MRPVARTVTFASNNSIYVIPPSPPSQQQQQQCSPEPPQQPQTPPQHKPEQHHDDAPEPQPQAPPPEQPAEAEPPSQTQDAPPPAEPKPPKGPKRGKKKQSGRVRFGPEPPPPQQQEQPQQQQEEEEHDQAQGPRDDSGDAKGQQGPHGAAPAPAQGQGYLLRYTPSPLPRWEATPRRHEYFSGEYRSYYPTPVREGIYRIATDANRLTTIFSEENPNACTIA